MPLPSSALDYWDEQRQVSARTLAIAKRLWLRMGGSFDAAWDQIAPVLVASVEKGQLASAELASDFVPEVLDAQGIDVPADADPIPQSVVGVTGGGVPLEEALYASVIGAKQAVKDGSTTVAALQTGGSVLQMLVSTALSDSGRAVESLGVATRPSVGYVRMLEGESCSRCIILAGRFYRWSAGFKRHPRCDCRHIPATEKVANKLTIDPDKYFRSLSKAEQDARFGAANAQAIRDGADMGQVVNAQKGMQQAQVYGRNLKITTEGVTKRGVAGKVIRARGRDPRTTPRLMPSTIYDIAEDRADALRLLRANGYVVNRNGVPTSGRGSRTGLADLDRGVVDLDRIVVRPPVVPAAPRRVPPVPSRPAVAGVTTESVAVLRRSQVRDIEAALTRAARDAGRTPDELVAQSHEALSVFAQDKRVAVNMKEDGLLSFLRDGYYRNRFETGVSGGSNDAALRSQYEQAWFGTDSKPPTYGYLRSPDDRPSAADAYGKFALVLKDSPNGEGISVSTGDSLGRSESTIPAPLDDLGRFTGDPSQAAQFSTAQEYADALNGPLYRRNYVEAQIHRRVSVDDVAEVVLRESPSPAVRDALTQAGLPFRVARVNR